MNYKVVLNTLSIFAVSAALVACSDKAEPPASPALSVSAAVPPSLVAQKYEGKIVRQPSNNRGKDDGWYLVKDGKRRWIINGSWLEDNGFKNDDVVDVSASEFYEIPENLTPIE